MNSEEEILGKLLGIIENAENEEEIENGVKSIASEYGNMNSNQSNYGLNQNTTVDFYNKLTNVLKENQNDFKNMILNDSDMIIKLFCNVKDIAENMNNNKRGIDAISNQTLILNKKYLEPYEKFIKSISYKHNLDSTIELYELIKIFKSEIKVLKVYFENEKNTIIDSNNFLLFNAIVKIKKILTERESDLSGIIYLKEDLIWFKESEGKIFKIFRAKFHDVLKSMEKLQITKFLEFYSQIDTNLLISEIRDFINGQLREIMIDKLYKKLIQGKINQINQLDLITENIMKIRTSIKEYFTELETYKLIMKNLGEIIKSEYDKNNFVFYDEIMEIKGLQGIYVVFIETIELNLVQIIKNLKSFQKLGNAYNYFTKDFLFFYFQYKLHCRKIENEFNAEKTLYEIKNNYIEKFSNAIKENFNRAYNLVKNVEKNVETIGKFEKENIVNLQIIEHLVNYIVNMSKSFMDLSDEFESDWETLISDDEVMSEIKNSFSNSLLENYLDNIFLKLDSVIRRLDEDSKDIIEIQKFYFFYYILYKIKDVCLSFLNSNISYLITENLYDIINSKLEFYMNGFYNCFLNHVAKDVKILLMNKDAYNLKNLTDNQNSLMKLFFNSFNYNHNKSFEKFTSKFMIYIYYFNSCLILLNLKFENDSEMVKIFDDFFKSFDEFVGIFFKMSENKMLTHFHNQLKYVVSINDSNQLQEELIKQNTQLNKLIYSLRIFSANESSYMSFIKSKKINLDLFARLTSLILMKYSKIKIDELKFMDTDIQKNLLQDIEQILTKTNK